jgi:hypothetical protein
LTEPAPEAGIVESQVIPKYVKKRTLGIHVIQDMGLAIYFQRCAHG